MSASTNFGVAIFGFLASFLVSFIIFKTKHLHSEKMLDQLDGIQKFHSVPTPRIGGVALAGGFLLGWILLTGDARLLFGLLCVSGFPVLALGLAEDIFKTVSVRVRLLASILAGLLFCSITGYSIERIFVWWFDPLLGISAISIGLTVFAIASATNALNIIDGFHGLASGTILLMLAAIGFASWSAGDTVLFQISCLIFATTLGFFLVNFPFGGIFLGDGGAYFLGFIIAALTVMLPARNSEISPWISPLILSYPLTELIVSMIRKARREGHYVSQPDSLHLHMLVHRAILRRLPHQMRAEAVVHALTSATLWVFPATSLVLITVSKFESFYAIRYTIAMFCMYLILYTTSLIDDRKIGG